MRVPLPEPDCRLPMDGPPRYRADQMLAHAAAVSAADNKALREALQEIIESSVWDHCSIARAALKEKP